MIFLFLFSIVSTSGCLEDEVSNSSNNDESNNDNYYDYNDNSSNQDTGASNLDSDSDGYGDNSDKYPNDASKYSDPVQNIENTDPLGEGTLDMALPFIVLIGAVYFIFKFFGPPEA